MSAVEVGQAEVKPPPPPSSASKEPVEGAVEKDGQKSKRDEAPPSDGPATKSKSQMSKEPVSKEPVSKEPPETKEATKKKERGEDKDHQNWGNPLQFILTAVGLAVGLGNVWKFPYVAYENGGSAFLIPYIIFGVTFGMPVIYAEFYIGQYTRASPARSFYRLAPAFSGIGVFMALVCVLVGAFYAVVIGWAELYLAMTIGGQSYRWTRCDNDWNTAACIATQSNLDCLRSNATTPYALDNAGLCGEEPSNATMNAAAQFFLFYVVKSSSGFDEFGDFNWRLAVCLVVFYIFCALTLWKGIRILEKTSYVTVPLPYIVVLIFFIRALFLDGSWIGIKHYLFAPDMEKLLHWKTWQAALTQLCFSLTLGFGALISLSSHNRQTNNCFRDAILVVCFDTLMSVIGGVAVFGTLGYLSKISGRPFEKVVSHGPGLAFIAYPEATSTMPASWLWNFLFFMMLLLLGFSSMVGIIDCVSNIILDSIPALKSSQKWKVITPCAICAVLCFVGVLFSTGAGYWFFDLLASFTDETGPCIAVALEVIMLAYAYQFSNVREDMEEMWGEAPKGAVRRFFSRYSAYFKWNWMLVAPIFALVVTGFTLARPDISRKTDGITYPVWAEIVGWTVNLGPVLVLPIFFLIHWCDYSKKGIAFKYLFMPTKGLPSHDRYYKAKGIAPPEGWADEESTSDVKPDDGSSTQTSAVV